MSTLSTAPVFHTARPAATGKDLINVGGYIDQAHCVLVQSDGKIVLAGSSTTQVLHIDFSLIRLNTDGTLDTSFSGDGKTLIANSTNNQAASMALQSDGKIVLAGSSGYQFSVIRLNTDGSLDTSFSDDGKALFGAGTGQSVTLQDDGKIVLVGYNTTTSNNSSSDLTAIRLNADGSLDTGFGNGGQTLIDIGGASDEAHGVAVQSDGKLLISGYGTNSSGNSDFILVRLNTDGTLDTGFSDGGKALIDIGTSDKAYGMTMQSDGKVLLAGSSDSSLTLIRLNTDGTLDTSFSEDGKALLGGGVVQSVTVQDDGKILLTKQGDFSLMRLNADGSTDTGFGTNGWFSLDANAAAKAYSKAQVIAMAGFYRNNYVSNTAYSVAVQDDGKILLTGSKYNGNFNVIRLNADGTLDSTFGDLSGGVNWSANSTLDGTLSQSEGMAQAALLDASVAVYDAELAALDGGAGSYSGASLTLSRHGGASSHDVFSGLGNLSLSGGHATLSGVSVGSVSNAGGQLVITFNASATQDRVNETLSSIGYANPADAARTSVQIDWVFSDGASTAPQSVTDSTTVTFTSNTAPVFHTVPPAGAGKPLIDIGGYNDEAHSVSVQSDGRMLVAGYSTNSSGSTDFSVVRLSADGKLDTSFSAGGKALIDVYGYGDQAHSVSVQSDGKIVLAGTSGTSTSNDFSVVRLNADGSPDTSFSDDGKASFSPSIYSGDGHGQSMAMQSDGKIVVGGWNPNMYSRENEFSVIRLNTDGSLDTSFDGDGKTNFFNAGIGQGLTLQSDNKVVLVGYQLNSSSNNDFTVVRLNADGALDATLGGGGQLMIDIGGYNDEAHSVAMQSDGKMIVAGYSASNLGVNDFSVIRLNTNGSLDTGFSGDGKAVIDVGGYGDQAYSVAVQSDGKIVLAGSSANSSGATDFSVVRLNTNGSLDTSFSDDGKALIDIGGYNDQAYSVTLQSDGKLVLAGNSASSSGATDFSVIRLNADGSLDTSFGDLPAGVNWSASSTLGGTVSYTERAAQATALDASVAVYDAELAALNGGTGNYSGASVSLSRHGGASSQDLFSGLGSLSLAGGSATLSGVKVGSVSNAGGKLVITFNASATQERVNETLSNIGYANSAHAPSASVQIDWLFSDGNRVSPLHITDSTRVNISPVNDAATGSVTFGGIIKQGQTLTAANTLADLDGMGTVSYQWQADGVTITGATAKTLVLGQAQVGKAITVTASYTDGAGTHESKTSAASAAVLDTAAPRVIAFAPADETAGVAPSSHITLTFSEAVVKGTGGIVLKTAAGAVIASYDVATSTALTLSSDKTTLTLNPASDLAFSTAYKVELAPGTFKDLAGNSYAGTTSYNFSTVGTTYTGTADADKLIGGVGNDTLNALAGNDTLNGGSAADTMTGGDGNDIYYVDNTHDVVTETSATGGTDRVNSHLSAYTLGKYVENGLIQTTATASLTGNGLNNLLYAGAGSNVLNGGSGTDTVSYYCASAGVSVSLATTTAQATGGSGSDTLLNVENLTGSSYNDTLKGNTGDNILNGLNGNDLLNGAAGNDVLIGGLGVDRLTGGTGADRFDFNSLAELGLIKTTWDTITDFKTSEGDKIDLRGVDANTALIGDQAFTFVGTVSAFTGDATGRLRFDAVNHILYGSTDADTDAEFAIALTGVKILVSADLML